MSSPAGSAFVAGAGVWVLCQLFAGDALRRLLILRGA